MPDDREWQFFYPQQDHHRNGKVRSMLHTTIATFFHDEMMEECVQEQRKARTTTRDDA